MFRMELIGSLRTNVKPLDLPSLDPELDDYRSIVVLLCDYMHEQPVEFLVQGFGEDRWGVDVGFDLLVILDQLPDLFTWLSTDKVDSRFNLDFYEQGVERRVELRAFDDTVLMEGTPIFKHERAWQPAVATEQATRDALRADVSNLVARFLELSGQICPACVNHPWLVAHFSPVVAHRTS